VEQVEIEYMDNRGLAWLMPEEAQRLVQRGEARLTGRTRTLSPENKVIVPEYSRHREVR